MSFGAGEILKVGTLIYQTYQSWKDAPRSFKNISAEVTSLRSILSEVDRSVAGRQLSSSQRYNLENVLKGCRGVLIDLRETVEKSQSLALDNGSRQRRAWDRLRWEEKEVERLRSRLIANILLLGQFMALLPPSIEIQSVSLLEPNHVAQNTIHRMNEQVPEVIQDLITEEHIARTGNTEIDTRPNISEGTTPRLREVSSNTSSLSLVRDKTSEGSLTHLSLGSQTTISSVASSTSSSSSTIPSATKDTNKKFVRKAVEGDTVLLLTWLGNPAIRTKLCQESINAALLQLTKNPRHGPRRLEAVRLVLKECAPDLYYEDAHGGTPLIWASYFDHEEIVKLLLQNNANPLATDRKYGRPPLLWAAKKGSSKAAKLLLDHMEHGWNINSKDVEGNSAVALAYSENEKHLTVTKLLLHYGADPNYVLQTGMHLLLSAIDIRAQGLVGLLIEKGADIGCYTPGGFPLLSVAVRHMPVPLIHAMIHKGADMEAMNPKGQTPLITAIEYLRDDVVKLLLGLGANRKVEDCAGVTVQAWAKWSVPRVGRRIFDLVVTAG